MLPFFRGVALSAGLACAAIAAKAQENVMVVFDGSNSMWGQIEGTAKIEIARNVMDSLLGEWTDDRQVGLMAYGHRRRGDCGDIETLVQPGAGTRATILEQVNAISPRGKTPLTDAVEQAARQLAYTDRPATVVLISDGLESCDRDPCALAQALETGGVGFTAHVVGFGLGADQDDAQLACIAEETGGTYIQAANAEELKAAMSSVSTAVAEAEPEPEPVPEPAVTLQGPDTALAGSDFEVSWAPSFAPRDYITIVPTGAQEGTSGNYVRVKDHSEGTLRAPGDAGAYELRYVSNETDETLGRASIEITEPEVTVSAPDSALAGSTFKVSWTGTVHNRDYITIVPMGADPNESGNYFRVGGSDDTKSLKAPADTGLYEVRYVLNEGKRVMASQTIEVTEPEVTVSAPDSALAGSTFKVSWTGTVHNRDYITIVPMGADPNESGNYFRVGGSDDTKSLKAPANTGLYEVRYVLNEGKRVMASQTIEVTEPEVTVSAPDEIRAGDTIRVTWTGAVHPRDYITIVPAGSDDDRGDYFRVGDRSERDMTAPDTTGLYELRYVLNEGKRVMASTRIEVLAEDATLEKGASLEAPDTAAAGTTIEVGWSVDSDSADQRITLAGGSQAIFTWIEAVKITGAPPVTLTLPDESGVYELRFLDVSNQSVLARKVIEVE